jgi:hypothetical protein
MKNVLTVILLLLTINLCVAQESDTINKPEHYVEFGMDPLYMVGEDSQGYVDWVVKLGSEVGEYGNIAAFYERNNGANYVSYGIQPGFVLPIAYGFHANLGTELSIIERYGLEGMGLLYTSEDRSHDLTYAFNVGLSYRLHKNLSLGYSADFKHRPDINPGTWADSYRLGLKIYFL